MSKDWLINQGVDIALADIFARGFVFTLIFILSIITYWIAKRFILKGIATIIGKTKTEWDDIILKKKVFNRLAYLAPAIVIYLFISIPFEDYEWLINFFKGTALIYMIVIVILTIDAFLNALLTIYETYEVSKRIPIKGFIQVFKIIVYFTCGIFIISILVDKTPIYLFSSLGALTAVLMFIFKD